MQFLIVVKRFERTWLKLSDAVMMQAYTRLKITPQLWCNAVAEVTTTTILRLQLWMWTAI